MSAFAATISRLMRLSCGSCCAQRPSDLQISPGARRRYSITRLERAAGHVIRPFFPASGPLPRPSDAEVLWFVSENEVWLELLVGSRRF
mmetsp:Transcript_3538/g.9088  ORF Transcript_3538/g.9088 Transcript_3538/m.9088 type:complete len:89 (-) Transcript_3538:351-617(-)